MDNSINNPIQITNIIFFHFQMVKWISKSVARFEYDLFLNQIFVLFIFYYNLICQQTNIREKDPPTHTYHAVSDET